MKNKGLTLVEVLVCVAIIAIISALAFSGFRSGVTATKTTVCVSNLGQISKAMLMYNSDYGSFPPDNPDHPALRPYLGGVRFVCPLRDNSVKNHAPSYYLHASFPATPNSPEALCKEIRGSAFPIAHDANHHNGRESITSGTSFYIYARMDGSVSRTNPQWDVTFAHERLSFPCPSAEYYVNF